MDDALRAPSVKMNHITKHLPFSKMLVIKISLRVREKVITTVFFTVANRPVLLREKKVSHQTQL